MGDSLVERLRAYVRGLKHMSRVDKIGAVLGAVVFIVAISALISYLIQGSEADRIRAEIRAHMAAEDFISARESLRRLAEVPGGLTLEDRSALRAPVHAALTQQSTRLLAAAREHFKVAEWDLGLEVIEQAEVLGGKFDQALLLHADLLRKAKREDEALEHYRQFRRLFPDSTMADDALFWQALIFSERRDKETAENLLRQLLEEHPRTNFLSSTKRMLGELHATATFEVEDRQITLDVDMAGSPERRSRGLEDREHIAPTEGMVYLFPKSDKHLFWTKHYKVPVDIIFLNEQFSVVGVVNNAEPGAADPHTIDEPSKYVIETLGGFVQESGVQLGTKVALKGMTRIY